MITETCGCGASIKVDGASGGKSESTIVENWRKDHNCRRKVAPGMWSYPIPADPAGRVAD